MLFPDDVYNEEAGEIGLAFCVLCAIPQGSPDKVQEREMMCNWCGDLMKEGLWEVHKCLEQKEGEHADFPTAI